MRMPICEINVRLHLAAFPGSGASFIVHAEHAQKNVQAYIPRKSILSEVADDIRIIFSAPDRATAETWLAQPEMKY
jgi:hypothetical protein